ncbi:MAG: secretin N-terminal domain-containing protein [Cyanobacteriota bacterium]
MIWRRRQKYLSALVTLSVVLSVSLLQGAQAANNPMFKSKINMAAPISFKQANAVVPNLDDEEISLRKLLRQLGRFAGINIILDESIEGSVSVSFDNVTVKEALDYLRDIAGLYYVTKGDNILLVTTKATAVENGLTKDVTKIIPIKYVNSKFIAALLNNTVFKASGDAKGGAGDTSKKATAEFRTNSIILVGTDNDIRLAQDMIEMVDIPRESKAFKINHAGPIEVAQLLQATIFNDGVTPFGGASTGSGGTGEGLPSSPTEVNINIETFQEGSGSDEVQGASGDGGGGSSQSFTLRTKQLSAKTLRISPDGPVIIPDTRTGTLTIMGTVEQIALAEAVIPTLDQKLPQVAIETSLVELLETGTREGKITYGGSSGQFATGFANTNIPQTPTAGAPAAGYRELVERQRIVNGQVITDYYLPGVLNNVIGIPTSVNKGQEGFSFNWTTVPLERSDQFIAQIDNIIQRRKGKLLANPTVIAIHNSEAIISITEEIVRTTQVTRDQTGFTQTQVEIGEAGIVLNILPKVTGDGYVVLRIRPSVSTIASVENFGDNQVTLLNRRDLAIQEIRVANGQTLALGGLIQESDLSNGARVPGLASLPIIGAMFRTSYKSSERTELITLVTPRIMEDVNPLSSTRISSLMKNPEFQAMIQRSNSMKQK